MPEPPIRIRTQPPSPLPTTRRAQRGGVWLWSSITALVCVIGVALIYFKQSAGRPQGPGPATHPKQAAVSPNPTAATREEVDSPASASAEQVVEDPKSELLWA